MAERMLEVHVGSGLDSLRFGMDEPQVRAGLATLGNVVDSTAPGGALKLRTEGLDDSFSVYASFGSGGFLFTLEVWRPNDTNLIDLNLYGIPIFATPADSALVQLAEIGHRLDFEDKYHPVLPEASIGLDRESGDDCDNDGLARYFQSIFIAPDGYYSN
ncbi:hypothetical protein OG884_05115 [Streptosporangium sp. NBC_01755]|uniref:hypothetical protein n=1 Tax=unclassified Streptosporangium TaxID=2632669 RepID=UPI002DDAB28C|nr:MULTISPECIES: hypothetical protein [unclassified Streptosporangium]WSA27126.1 hypothetical protein OIE13_04370 [Streptosporangium sp. NBC_01810]WSD01313.1 hypothetical protein OG884_05115 [Streptosporangium sp. NBC_01755]